MIEDVEADCVTLLETLRRQASHQSPNIFSSMSKGHEMVTVERINEDLKMISKLSLSTSQSKLTGLFAA